MGLCGLQAQAPACLGDVITVYSVTLQLDDEEAAKEEEAEALRLQRKEAEALRPEDFGQLSEPESEEEAEDGEEEAGTLGAAAARVSPLPSPLLLKACCRAL